MKAGRLGALFLEIYRNGQGDERCLGEGGREYLLKHLSYSQKRSIIIVITIILKNFLLLNLFLAAGSIGLQRGAAQQAVPSSAAEAPATASAPPASLVARNITVASSRPVSSATPANATAQHPSQTKVVRIYGGAGYFDIALAEELRPRLAKGFASAKPGSAKPASGQVSVPGKTDDQKKVTTASNL